MQKLALTTLAVFGLSTALAFAQTPTSFTDVDTDASGELSFSEAQVAWPDLTQAAFDAADSNASGGLSEDEYNGLLPADAAAAPAAAPAMAPDAMAPASGAESAVTPDNESLDDATLGSDSDENKEGNNSDDDSN